ncbi:hypothetical protein BU15DRAFT_67832 [Melanogaster broomeanus]|nr:hypothetical protein BU15DRAFT_67832 [Melanogaster broomeanus]
MWWWDCHIWLNCTQNTVVQCCHQHHALTLTLNFSLNNSLDTSRQDWVTTSAFRGLRSTFRVRHEVWGDKGSWGLRRVSSHLIFKISALIVVRTTPLLPLDLHIAFSPTHLFLALPACLWPHPFIFGALVGLLLVLPTRFWPQPLVINPTHSFMAPSLHQPSTPPFDHAVSPVCFSPVHAFSAPPSYPPILSTAGVFQLYSPRPQSRPVASKTNPSPQEQTCRLKNKPSPQEQTVASRTNLSPHKWTRRLKIRRIASRTTPPPQYSPIASKMDPSMNQADLALGCRVIPAGTPLMGVPVGLYLLTRRPTHTRSVGMGISRGVGGGTTTGTPGYTRANP